MRGMWRFFLVICSDFRLGELDADSGCYRKGAFGGVGTIGFCLGLLEEKDFLFGFGGLVEMVRL